MIRRNRKWFGMLGLALAVAGLVLLMIRIINPKAPQEVPRFTLDVDIQGNDDALVPPNERCRTVGECSALGDQYVEILMEEEVYHQWLEGMNESPLETAESMEAENEPTEEETPYNVRICAKYEVKGDQLEQFEGAPTSEQEQEIVRVWHIFTDLVPREWRQNLEIFGVFEGSTPFAYVESVYTEGDRQGLWVNIELTKDYPTFFFEATLIHEFGHLFTMDMSQVSEALCADPLAETAYCTREDSYLNQFSRAFWKDVPAGWHNNFEEKSKREADEFAAFNRDNFVSAYASVNLLEDIAESFTCFVLEPRPERVSLPRDKKLLFFYRYPELVYLRLQILEGMMKQREREGSGGKNSDRKECRRPTFFFLVQEFFDSSTENYRYI